MSRGGPPENCIVRISEGFGAVQLKDRLKGPGHCLQISNGLFWDGKSRSVRFPRAELGPMGEASRR